VRATAGNGLAASGQFAMAADSRAPTPLRREMRAPTTLRQGNSLELPVEDLLRRARPLPPREELVIDDLTTEDGEAFLGARDA
jgi:hypothetical protein